MQCSLIGCGRDGWHGALKPWWTANRYCSIWNRDTCGGIHPPASTVQRENSEIKNYVAMGAVHSSTAVCVSACSSVSLLTQELNIEITELLVLRGDGGTASQGC